MYTDGSVYEGRWRDVQSVGFAIVAVGGNGRLAKYGMGVPPQWIDSSPAAEAWAVLVARQESEENELQIFTDCKVVVDLVAAGVGKATSASCSLARSMRMLASTARDGLHQLVSNQKLVWMPAHLRIGTYSLRRRSDGASVSPIDFRANRLVDVLAKAAAGDLRAAIATRQLLTSAAAAVKHAAALLAVTTRAANNHLVVVTDPDGSQRTVPKRDSCRVSAPARSRKKRASAALRDPPAPAEVVLHQDSLESEEEDAEAKKRPRRGTATSSFTPCLFPPRRAAERAGQAREERLQSEALDYLVAERALSAARLPPISASQRMAELRQRILARLEV
jgi:hypothetical protein